MAAASNTAVAMLVFLIATLGACRHAGTDEQNFIANFKRVQGFSCAVPQPRLFAIAEHPKKDPGMIYYPSATVLHRCDSPAGYCSSPLYECGASHEEKVQIVFFATSLRKEAKRTFRHLEFVNHTRCACISKVNDHPR